MAVGAGVLIYLFGVLHKSQKVLPLLRLNWILQSLVMRNTSPMIWLHFIPQEVLFDYAFLLSWLIHHFSVGRVSPLEIRQHEKLLWEGELIFRAEWLLVLVVPCDDVLWWEVDFNLAFMVISTHGVCLSPSHIQKALWLGWFIIAEVVDLEYDTRRQVWIVESYLTRLWMASGRVDWILDWFDLKYRVGFWLRLGLAATLLAA